jgi:hypothetical protein
MAGVKRPHGTVRRGQMLQAAGPGAMMDLPDYSILVGGLDGWRGYDAEPIYEPRLSAKVQVALGLPQVKLYAPPAWRDEPQGAKTGVTAYPFPKWFIAQGKDCEQRLPDGSRSRPLVHQMALTKRKFIYNKKSCDVVPVRFVQACPNGHIEDIDWSGFVHRGTKCSRQLWLDERGTSGDLRDLTVRCECGMRRGMMEATIPGAFGPCRGSQPWLGHGVRQECKTDGGKNEMARLLIRSASNSYFSQQLSVISIPEQGKRVREAVGKVWDDFLCVAESPDDIVKERKKPKVKAALEGLSNEEVWKEVERRLKGSTPTLRPIKTEELETLLASEESAGEDVPDGDFYARAVKLPKDRSPLMKRIARVVLVHRLREVVAQIGFTRFEAPIPDIDGELKLDVRRAPLARDVTWVPAVENRGEGVFILLDEDALKDWESRVAVQKRDQQLRNGFARWIDQHEGSALEYPKLRYFLLHSLAHLLITAVALESGYQASSTRERIYVGDAGSGILLHTGSSDAEGTLGGLVQMGRHFERHLRKALELGRLCSNDPVCAQHDPDDARAERYLMGAACHGCLLISETSCERRNEMLDRALVVATVDGAGAEFFPDEEL